MEIQGICVLVVSRRCRAHGPWMRAMARFGAMAIQPLHSLGLSVGTAHVGMVSALGNWLLWRILIGMDVGGRGPSGLCAVQWFYRLCQRCSHSVRECLDIQQFGSWRGAQMVAGAGAVQTKDMAFLRETTRPWYPGRVESGFFLWRRP